MNLRESPIRSRKVLDSARGAACSARFPGICNGNPETTVWAHLNGAAFGKGLGQKAHDVLGFHSCSDCHRYYDVGHGTRPLISDELLLECVLSAVCETYVRLIRVGLVVIPLDVERLSHDRPTPPRKPPEQRTKIPQRENQWPTEGRKLVSRNNLRKSPAAHDEAGEEIIQRYRGSK